MTVGVEHGDLVRPAHRHAEVQRWYAPDNRGRMVVATIVIGSVPGQAVMTPVALSEPPSIVDAMPAPLTYTRPGNRWWTPPRSSASTPLMKMNRSSSP